MDVVHLGGMLQDCNDVVVSMCYSCICVLLWLSIMIPFPCGVHSEALKFSLWCIVIFGTISRCEMCSEKTRNLNGHHYFACS
jgi:hypothetical protein